MFLLQFCRLFCFIIFRFSPARSEDYAAKRSPHPSRHLPHMPRFAFPASSSSVEVLIHFNNHNPRMIRTSIGIKDIKRLDHRPIGQLAIQKSIPPAPCNHAPRTLGRHHASFPASDISVKLSAIFPFAIRNRDSIRSWNPLLKRNMTRHCRR